MILTRLSVLAGLLLAALSLIQSSAHAAQLRNGGLAARPLGPHPAAKPARRTLPRSLAAAMKAWRNAHRAPAAAPKPCADTATVPDASNVEAIRASVLCLINEERAAKGHVALVDNPQLEVAAQRHSDDMVGRGYFGHITPEKVDFDTRIFATGYADRADPSTYEILAENIAWGVDTLGTPAKTVERWMASPAHRANILNGTLRESGIGVGLGAPDAAITGPAATYTQDFGTH